MALSSWTNKTQKPQYKPLHTAWHKLTWRTLDLTACDWFLVVNIVKYELSKSVTCYNVQKNANVTYHLFGIEWQPTTKSFGNTTYAASFLCFCETGCWRAACSRSARRFPGLQQTAPDLQVSASRQWDPWVSSHSGRSFPGLQQTASGPGVSASQQWVAGKQQKTRSNQTDTHSGEKKRRDPAALQVTEG